MAKVELEAGGSAEAITRLITIADERGFIVRVENPAAPATGGRMEIEVTNIDEQAMARAAVQALINEVPSGPATFTII